MLTQLGMFFMFLLSSSRQLLCLIPKLYQHWHIHPQPEFVLACRLCQALPVVLSNSTWQASLALAGLRKENTAMNNNAAGFHSHLMDAYRYASTRLRGTGHRIAGIIQYKDVASHSL